MTPRLSWARWFGGGALLALVSACEVEEIVLVATEPGPLGEGGVACSSSAECELGDYCARRACSAPAGSCRRPPSVCDSTLEPVCGCDGVTYFNDCLRELSGVAAATPGVCQDRTMRCGDPEDPACPVGAYCAKLFPLLLPLPICPDELPGTCWVLPVECDAAAGALRWQPCGGARAAGSCEDLCTAIRSELPRSGSLTCRD